MSPALLGRPNKTTMMHDDSKTHPPTCLNLSQSFPGAILTNALRDLDEDSCQLSSSCFARGSSEGLGVLRTGLDETGFDFDDGGEEGDCDLTSLSWLQKKDLLKTISFNEKVESSAVAALTKSTSTPARVNNNNRVTNGAQQTTVANYDPTLTPFVKPPYSFSCLIFMAIESAANKQLSVKDIYKWIVDHFPYFRNAPQGWRNSVRHNLSLNKCFTKVARQKGHGLMKGSYWCIDGSYRPNLLAALRKIPHFPVNYEKLATYSPPPSPQPANEYSLSPQSSIDSLACSCSDSEIEAAKAMMSFSRSSSAPKKFSRLRQRSRNAGSLPRGILKKNKSCPPLINKSWSSLSTSSTSKKATQTTIAKHNGARHKRKSGNNNKVATVPSADHTYFYGSTVTTEINSPQSSGGEDPLDSDLSELTDYDAETDSEFDQSCSGGLKLQDSGYGHQLKRKLKRSRRRSNSPADIKDTEEPAAKRTPRDDIDVKEVEGVESLLNLAGIKTNFTIPLRPLSPVELDPSNVPLPFNQVTFQPLDDVQTANFYIEV